MATATLEFKAPEKMTTLIKKPKIDLSVTELRFEETVSLSDGVKRTINWMRKFYSL